MRNAARKTAKWSGIGLLSFILFPIALFAGLALLAWRHIPHPHWRNFTTAALALCAVLVAPSWTHTLTNPEPVAEKRPVQEAPPASEPAPVKTTPAAQDPEPKAQAAGVRVVKVVDGDTVEVALEGGTARLRLIGMDTPETVDPRKPVQCYGREATARARQLLEGTTVQLESDPTQGDKDKYGRLLRYITLPDGQNFNRTMIAEGFAHEYTYAVPYKYQASFKEAQAQAAQAKRGLWGPGTCQGHTSKPAAAAPPKPAPQAHRPAPAPTQAPRPRAHPAPTPVTAPAPVPAPAPRPVAPMPAPTGPYFANCTAAWNAGAAPLYAGQPGYRSRLDGDGDGVACEKDPR